jgi:cytochrome-b5 reductase
MLQIIRAILDDPEDQTIVHLIFANQTEEDIFLRAELEALPKKRFHLWYTLDRPPKNWKYSSGFVNTEMCREHLPAPGADVFYLMCGPPPMLKFAIDPAFQELGIPKEQTYAF